MGVFGSEYVFYLSIGVSCLTFFIWTYGVWLVSGDKSQMSFKNCITNPNLIMILIGLVCFFFSIHPPALMATILDDLGALNTGLVMLVLEPIWRRAICALSLRAKRPISLAW